MGGGAGLFKGAGDVSGHLATDTILQYTQYILILTLYNNP